MGTKDRRTRVLKAIVRDYVSAREPVGSRSLVERYDLGVSPATIRNDMAALEEAGLIHQPHTSAGRIPTDQGYRHFVDSLDAVKPLSAPERRAIERVLSGAVDLDDEGHRLTQPGPQCLVAHEAGEGTRGLPATGRKSRFPGCEPVIVRQSQRTPRLLVGGPQLAHGDGWAIRRARIARVPPLPGRVGLKAHRPGEARRRSRSEEQSGGRPAQPPVAGTGGRRRGRGRLRRAVSHQASSSRQWRVSPATTVLVSSGTTAMALASDRPCSRTVPGGVVGSAR